MNQLACPKCHEPLLLENNSYKCCNRHTYDLSKTKYLNLLLNPDKATNNPGDSKESLIARKLHLNAGYYDIIANTLCDLIHKYKQDSKEILDLGCGEGYYTKKIKESFEQANVYGLDISKEAINMATKYRKDIYWLVGNTKNIPVLDHSMDIISGLFTVINKDEIERCLKQDGYMIHVTANAYHLVEFKELIYGEVKIKSDEYIRLPFNVVESFDIKQQVHLDTSEATLNLLKMTPHFYHIKKENRSILDELQPMDITIDVKFTVYALQD